MSLMGLYLATAVLSMVLYLIVYHPEGNLIVTFITLLVIGAASPLSLIVLGLIFLKKIKE